MPLAEPKLILVIGFKQAVEKDVSVQRSGVGAGEIVARGTASFLGREISRDVLVYQGRDKAVLYNYATEIKADGLTFTLSLDDFRTDYETAVLSEDVQAVSDQIVESFELTE
jgi:hypothetical protein